MAQFSLTDRAREGRKTHLIHCPVLINGALNKPKKKRPLKFSVLTLKTQWYLQVFKQDMLEQKAISTVGIISH